MPNALETFLRSVDGYVPLSRDFGAAVHHKTETAGSCVAPDNTPKFEV